MNRDERDERDGFRAGVVGGLAGCVAMVFCPALIPIAIVGGVLASARRSGLLDRKNGSIERQPTDITFTPLNMQKEGEVKSPMVELLKQEAHTRGLTVSSQICPTCGCEAFSIEGGQLIDINPSQIASQGAAIEGECKCLPPGDNKETDKDEDD